MKIYSFVVTFNRLQLLKKTLESLKSQTYPIDKIFVVNNGSTDGTTEWLNSQNDILVIHQENVGGAGGFFTGVKYAYENGADWIWMMDDDVFPEPTALENLMKFNHISECIMPTRYYRNGIKLDWGYYYDIKKRTITNGSRPKESAQKKSYYPINTGCFEGMLISGNIVELIGYPDPRFFISGDDTVYGLKASKYTNLILVDDSVLVKDQISTEKKVSPMYLYYKYRNFHLFEEYYKSIFNQSYSLIVHFANFYSIILRYIDARKVNKKIAKMALRYMLIGVCDSIRKKVGKTHPVK